MGKIIFALLAILPVSLLGAEKINLSSPDGKLKAVFECANGAPAISVEFNGEQMLKAGLGLQSQPEVFFADEKPARVETKAVNSKVDAVWGINSDIENAYTLAEIYFKKCSLVFRIYDNAVAYRIKSESSMTVLCEDIGLDFPAGSRAYAYPINGHVLHFQKIWLDCPVEELPEKNTLICPLLVSPKGSKQKVLITDADISNYPALNFRYDGKSGALKSSFAKYPRDLKPKGNALTPSSRENYLATGVHSTPWRVMIFSAQDKDLLCNDTVLKLSDTNSMIKDTSWIKPGLSAWEWWSGKKLEGVDFESGFNAQTYFYYADFAAKFSLPYMIIDGGWLENHDDVLHSKMKVDMPAVVKYAKKRGVGVFVWVRSRALQDRNVAEKYFSKLEALGVKGVKVDFVERDDAQAMEFFRSISELAADKKLMIVWHGSPKCSGMYAKYPNIVGVEGVRGCELNKMKPDLTPSHNVGLLFTRAVCGPFDYTPGAMRNTYDGEINGKPFTVNSNWPSAQGTRAHQAAMYVMYYEPIKTLCDSATSYEKEPPYTGFISKIPTTWDESVALDGEFRKFAAIARRKGDIWYAAAMCGSDAENYALETKFLKPNAKYEAEILSDPIEHSENASEYSLRKTEIKGGETLNIRIEQGGGFVAKFTEKK